MNFSFYKNYYLIKCFSQEKYRDDFNTGKNIHLNSCKYFHDVENEFQNDLEGLVAHQEEDCNGYIIIPNKNLKQSLDDFKSGKKDKDVPTMKVILDNSDILCETKGFKFFINGYLCCFYIIKKSQVVFKDNEIHFPCVNDYENFFYFIKQYSGALYAYISVYEAETLLKSLYAEMSSKGYNFSCGFVKYENISQEQKIEFYNNNNIDKIIFTKGKSFEYQNEFRIFLNHKDYLSNEYIEEKICSLTKSVIYNFMYLSHDFCREKGIKK